MAVDEFGREEGVDYTSQSWSVGGGAPTTSHDEAQAELAALDAAEAAALAASRGE